MYIGFNSLRRIDYYFVRIAIFYFVTTTNILYACALYGAAGRSPQQRPEEVPGARCLGDVDAAPASAGQACKMSALINSENI